MTDYFAGIVDLRTFVVAGLLLNLTPGPDFAYITAWSTRRGARAGTIAALGVGSGCLVHVVAAAFGLSALLAASANALTLIKWAGAIYLVWLGGKMMLMSQPDEATQTSAIATAHDEVGLATVFAQGMLTNVLNPKIALFFLAFLPQFVAPDATDKIAAFLLLGLVFTFNGLVCCIGFALLAARLGTGLRGSRLGPWLTRAMGAAMAAFGIRLAMWTR